MNDVEARMLAAANDRVARGAVWLDRTCPGWDAWLAERLDVGSWETCVLGQLSGDYDLAAEATEHESAWLIDHGFLLEAGTLVSYNDLSGAWEALIYARGARQFLAKATARLFRPRGLVHRRLKKPPGTARPKILARPAPLITPPRPGETAWGRSKQRGAAQVPGHVA